MVELVERSPLYQRFHGSAPVLETRAHWGHIGWMCLPTRQMACEPRARVVCVDVGGLWRGRGSKQRLLLTRG